MQSGTVTSEAVSPSRDMECAGADSAAKSNDEMVESLIVRVTSGPGLKVTGTNRQNGIQVPRMD